MLIATKRVIIDMQISVEEARNVAAYLAARLAETESLAEYVSD